MKENNKPMEFSSKPHYLWFISILLCALFLPIIRNFHITKIYICVFFILSLIVFWLTIFRIKFTKNNIEIINSLTFFLFKKTKKYPIENIYLIEVRKLKQPYQRPYIIIHFNSEEIISKNFFYRSFIYSNSKEIIPLLELLKSQGINIYINISIEFLDDYNQLIKYNSKKI